MCHHISFTTLKFCIIDFPPIFFFAIFCSVAKPVIPAAVIPSNPVRQFFFDGFNSCRILHKLASERSIYCALLPCNFLCKMQCDYILLLIYSLHYFFFISTVIPHICYPIGNILQQTACKNPFNEMFT